MTVGGSGGPDVTVWGATDTRYRRGVPQLNSGVANFDRIAAPGDQIVQNGVRKLVTEKVRGLDGGSGGAHPGSAGLRAGPLTNSLPQLVPSSLSSRIEAWSPGASRKRTQEGP